MKPEQCIANKIQYGIQLRCQQPYNHTGRHRWAEDKHIYPFGRLDPNDPLDQAIVRAWNRGAAKAR